MPGDCAADAAKSSADQVPSVRSERRVFSASGIKRNLFQLWNHSHEFGIKHFDIGLTESQFRDQEFCRLTHGHHRQIDMTAAQERHFQVCGLEQSSQPSAVVAQVSASFCRLGIARDHGKPDELVNARGDLLNDLQDAESAHCQVGRVLPSRCISPEMDNLSRRHSGMSEFIEEPSIMVVIVGLDSVVAASRFRELGAGFNRNRRTP